MIVRKGIRWNLILRQYWRHFIAMFIFAVVVVSEVKDSHLPPLSVAVPGLLGTAISILLGFRTNSAYQRWWEARKIWGAIVNDSRTLARQVMALPQGDGAAALAKDVIHRQIAWNYALGRKLRGLDPLEELEPLLSTDEIDALRAQKNVPRAMLHTQTMQLAEAHSAGLIDTLLFLPIENTLRRFSDHMGACERIKGTVFPTSYSYFISRAIWIFFFLLPEALAARLSWLTVPVAFSIGFIFLMIEGVGRALENPFENARSDTPMTSISRTIEIDLRQQLGETDLPPKMEPVDGVLM